MIALVGMLVGMPLVYVAVITSEAQSVEVILEMVKIVVNITSTAMAAVLIIKPLDSLSVMAGPGPRPHRRRWGRCT